MTEPTYFAQSLARAELEAAALRYAAAASGETLPTPAVIADLLDSAVRYCVASGHPSS
jgi:hypothetical protein